MNHYLEYSHENTVLEAYISRPTETTEKMPAVLLMHAWDGRDSFVKDKADYFSEKGYIGVALDNYGKGVIGKTLEEKSALMSPLMNDRAFLAKRLIAGFEAIKNLPYVDPTKIIVIGYCFGGLCALDLMRNGAELAGVITVHGLLDMPSYTPHYYHNTKVLALTGYNDPMVTPDHVQAFEHEMDKAHLDWQLMYYGNT
jgi:dienelactone hydrolase